MTDQVLNLLNHTRDFIFKGKKIKITFEEYLKSIDAEILDVTNPYEAARFKINGKVCVIYYKRARNNFSYNDAEFVHPIHNDWERGQEWIKDYKQSKLDNSELTKAQNELEESLKFIKPYSENFNIYNYLAGAFDYFPFKVEKLKNMEQIETAKISILQYKRIFLKEEK